MRAPLVASVAAHAFVAALILYRGAPRPEPRDEGEVEIDREAPAAPPPIFADAVDPVTSLPAQSPASDPESRSAGRALSPGPPQQPLPPEHEGIGHAPIGYDAPDLLEQIQRQTASWSRYLVPPVRSGAPSTWAPHDEFLEGHVPRSYIERAVTAQMHPILLCHGAGGPNTLSLDGDVRVAFTIDAHGKVIEAHDAGGSFADAAVRRCVIDAFLKLTFPWPPNGKPQTVTHTVFL